MSRKAMELSIGKLMNMMRMILATVVVTISITDDTLYELDETLNLHLANFTPGCVPLGAPTEHEVTITDDEVETFWRDGVVALRGVLSTEWTTALAAPMERASGRGEMVDMGQLSDAADPAAPAFAELVP